MRGYMFRNRWLALLFVGIVLASVTKVVGTGKGDGALDQAKQQIESQKAQADQFSSEHSDSASDDSVIYEFTPDEELIDSASGEDPTPSDAFGAEVNEDPEVVPSDELVIVMDDDAGATGQAE
ncbi:hypothetical protein A6F68_00221 [Tsuneonella dongtanensis]|uniref:Uncharacterized protein n=1 Tax=Tsuneonella dongtanensis TaxID=692370 RepID=A0A1B2A9C7_9SPHN|nr:hypothetical protein [Tsuneonella dongtanensis]ANY18756.1 hypothetical protein A6F68_00221 [Tsuneonella dongtanensis]